MLVKIFYRYFAIFLKINESAYSISLTYKLEFFVFNDEIKWIESVFPVPNGWDCRVKRANIKK